MSKKKYPEDEPGFNFVHPSQEVTVRHSDDMQLRAAGFKIYRRGKSGEALWTRKQRLYTQTEALRLVNGGLAAGEVAPPPLSGALAY